MDQIITAHPSVVTSAAAPTVSATATGIVYAGFWRRLIASALDALLVSLGTQVISGLADFTQNDVIILLAAIVNFVLSLAYYVYFVGNKGQTPGKMLLKLKVIRLTGGPRVGYGRAILREVVGKLISSAVFMLGHLWMIWDSKKQTWQDKMAGTIVVKV